MVKVRKAFTLVELLVVIAVIGILVAILLPAVSAARGAAKRAECLNQIRQLSLANESHAGNFKKFPVGLNMLKKSTKTFSMSESNQMTGLVELLPYIEEAELYKNWDRTGNAAAAANNGGTEERGVTRLIKIFRCPSEISPSYGDVSVNKVGESSGTTVRFARSNYAMCFGTDVLAPQGTLSNPRYDTDGAFRMNAGRGTGAFGDGLSKTVMFGEVRAGTKSGITGSSPKQSDVRGMWGFYMAGAAAYTHKLGPNSLEGDKIDTDHCENGPSMPCVAGAATLSEQYAGSRSNHVGGVHVSFGDGHAEFINDNIDMTAWRDMASID